MARFKLNAAHYLNVPGTEWEQIEVTAQGKQARHRYKVHRYLDPLNGEDFTDKINGWIVVTTKEDSLHPSDLVFIGLPSNEMEPLDEDAKALLSRMVFGPGAMSEQAFPTNPLQVFQNAPQTGDPMAEFRAMMAGMQGQLAVLSAQNAELTKKLAARDEEKLEEVEPTPDEIAAAQPKLPGITLGAS